MVCWVSDSSCDMTNLKINTNKTTYHVNDKVKESGAYATPSFHGSIIAPAPQEEPFKVLGVWFTMNLDWKEHKRRARGSLFAMCDAISRRSLTQFQLVEVINVMMIPTISYAMMVVEYESDELQKMDDQIERLVARHSKLCTGVTCMTPCTWTGKRED